MRCKCLLACHDSYTTYNSFNRQNHLATPAPGVCTMEPFVSFYCYTLINGSQRSAHALMSIVLSSIQFKAERLKGHIVPLFVVLSSVALLPKGELPIQCKMGFMLTEVNVYLHLIASAK